MWYTYSAIVELALHTPVHARTAQRKGRDQQTQPSLRNVIHWISKRNSNTIFKGDKMEENCTDLQRSEPDYGFY